jgi:hypothetical protein
LIFAAWDSFLVKSVGSSDARNITKPEGFIR